MVDGSTPSVSNEGKAIFWGRVTAQHKAWLVAAFSCVVSMLIWFGLSELSIDIRIAFITFALAVIGWVMTKLDDTYVALAAAMVFILFNIDAPGEFFEALGDNLIWLMIAAFIIASAVKASGLSDRLTRAVVARTHSVNHLFYALTAVMIVTAFMIPATSGRAALMVPVFIALAAVIDNVRIVRALALLIPVIILLSAFGSLVGAGAHLLAADTIWRMTGEKIDFLRWMMLGLPFALICCYVSTWVILRLFLTAEERSQPLQLGRRLQNEDSGRGLAGGEYYVIAVFVIVIVLWATKPLHGIDNAAVAIVGALAVTLRGIGPISLKQALKEVEWGLVLFLAATLELSEGLIDSGGASWLVNNLFTSMNSWFDHDMLLIAGIALIALVSHLVITSRSARTAILIPMIILMAGAMSFNPVAIAFLAVAATGYCLTLTVSAKPLLVFSQLSVPTYTASDLLRLSSVLLPFHFLLIMVFAYFVWPYLGLPLHLQEAVGEPIWRQPWDQPSSELGYTQELKD